MAISSTLPGAVLRAICVVALVTLPSMLLPIQSKDGAQIVALVAIFGAIFTLVEYTVASPSFIEFRSAPPFNRLRFIALFATVLVLSLIMRGNEAPSTLTLVLQLLGERIGGSLDFPFSPVRLIILMMPQDTPDYTLYLIRISAGLAYLVSLLSIAIFGLLLRFHHWPRRSGAFNVWVNMPMFDPTGGGDVVKRLNRDSQSNLILGFLLPFVFPAIGKLVSIFVMPITVNDPQTLIWMVAAWAFLPASLLMRGIALSRVAQLIHKQRKREYARAAAEGLLPV
ncbi:hypothetical protein SAMN05444339_103104 [Loktanella atrilutea]|uniref:Uncharacterized protein n=2 Tax=Loktanella atrilutea TaxID=366533 RepID=A0A1M4YFT2_LOKAT|nr:hypothetical protein [Loktanella atrilutea]SHF04528.1 hypothetical protein SAMN05444339_103104 [Loktanella atrilutea]